MVEPAAAFQSAPHVLIGGVPIFRGGLDAAVQFCVDRIRCHETTRVATANLDFLALARRQPQLLEDLQTSDLVVADGAPVGVLARLAGSLETKRVAGVDFVNALCESVGSNGGLRLVLYGSTDPIARAAGNFLESEFEGVTVVDVICPPFRALTPSEHVEMALRLARAHADVVLVALGCPAQERFAAELAPVVPGITWLGVGGSFDFFAGRRRRAPRLAQRLGLEWLVRLAQEPRRLAGRYLVRDAPELVRLAPGVLRSRYGTARRPKSGHPAGPAIEATKVD
ncbi:MAG: WecB/TagA/CpsF family glycosyltransferase [Tepidiformaceae bacterium]